MPPRLRHDGRTPAIKLLTSVNKAGSYPPRLTPLSRIFVATPVVISR